MKRYLLVLIAALAVVHTSTASAASGGAQRLEQFYRQVHTLSADFDQRVVNAEGAVIQSSAGHVVIQRPGHFRWAYTKPYNQLIVADGRTLWVYDPDLQQVTVRPMNKSLQDTPALLLSRKSSLSDTFRIQEMGEKDGLAWIKLLPKAQDSTFKQVLIGFADKGPQLMELTDSFDQVTRLRFKDLHTNVAVDESQFHFNPPAGVDVIKE